MWQRTLRQFTSKRGSKAKWRQFFFGIFGLIIAVYCPSEKYVFNEDKQPWYTRFAAIAWFALPIMLAEVLRRIIIFVELYPHLGTEGGKEEFKILLKKAFHNKRLTFLASLLSSIFGLKEVGAHWSLCFGIGGLYLILTSVLKISENPLEWDELLNDPLVHAGSELAYFYYYGFLRIVLPPIQPNVGPVLNLRQRAEKFTEENEITLYENKLFILIPDSCSCERNIQNLWQLQIEPAGQLRDVVIARGGMRDRPYSVKVYRIAGTENEEPFYVIIDMPSILSTLCEVNVGGEQHEPLSLDERRRQSKAFYRVLKNLLDNDPSCRDLYEIKFYK